MAMLVPILICCIGGLFLQVRSVVAQFGIVRVGLLLLISYRSRALFCFRTPPHSLLCISAYHTTVSHIKFCFVAYESLHVIVFVSQVSFKLDPVWCWSARRNFFVLVRRRCFAQCFGRPQLSEKKSLIFPFAFIRIPACSFLCLLSFI